MKATVTSALLVACAALILNACSTLVGGLIQSNIKKKESCKELLLDPDFTKKMQVEEFRAFYEKQCTKKENKAGRCDGLTDQSERLICLDSLERENAALRQRQKQSCEELFLAPDFIKKMQVKEFRAYYEKTCEKKESSAKHCRGLSDTSERLLCMDALEREKE